MAQRTSEASSSSVASGIFDTEVTSNRQVCDEHWRLTLRAEWFPPAIPGQFVQIHCGSAASVDDAKPDSPAGRIERPSGEPDFGRVPFVRRPFSMADVRRDTPDGVEIDILHRAIGPGTRWMATLRPGQRVNIIGPLGHGFRPAAGATLHVLVGGGIGVPPIFWLANELAGRGCATVAICGATQARWLPLAIEGGEDAAFVGAAAFRVREFGASPVVITTDDGSVGLRGRAIDGLRAVLDGRGGKGGIVAIYACGPAAMLRGVAALAAERGVACQVCLERMMACGMGTCQSCVVRVKDATAEAGWRYRLCCSDGPVFEAGDVVWD
jgi:dihydroorotate dehydrogenase electron transfer subunit